MSDLTGFKAYDICGRLGIDLDENIAYRIGAAFALPLETKTVSDVRASSEARSKSVVKGLIDQGCEVLDLGHQGSVFCEHAFRGRWRYFRHGVPQSDGLQSHEDGAG